MKIRTFTLEKYFAKYEFLAKYLLSSSDCDGIAVKELLVMADNESLKLWNDLHLGYTESLGLPKLRQEIAMLYKGIWADEVLVVTPEEGIFITINSILNRGDHMICPFPGYQSLYQVAESIGVEVTKWVPNEKKNWEFETDFLRQNIKPNTKLIVINFPHNPTGYMPTKEGFEEIINIAKERNIYVFSDEMYRFLEYQESERLPSASEIYDKAVALFGMSKTFGMAGVRIGWLICKDKGLYQTMANFKDYTTICSSGPSEILALMALRAKERIINTHLERIDRNLNILDSFFKRYKSIFEFVKPRAGTIAFPRLKINESSLNFAEKCVKETGVMILPSSVYGYDDLHFRIGFGRENMPEALGVFEGYIRKFV